MKSSRATTDLPQHVPFYEARVHLLPTADRELVALVGAALRAAGFEVDVGDDAGEAQRAYDARDVLTAIAKVKECLVWQSDHAGCQAVLTTINQKYGRAQHIKEFAVYKEGDGYMVYFNVVDPEGRVVDLLGEAELFVEVRTFNGGVPVRSWPVGKWPVRQTSYKAVTLGIGAFARPRIVTSQWIKENLLFDGAPRGRFGAEILFKEYNAYVRMVFTDVFGRTFEAEDDFLP